MARKKARRGWGSGSVYKTARGFGVRWYEPGGERRRKAGYQDREQAERVLDRILGEMAQGRSGLPADPQSYPTLATLADGWLTRRKVTHRSWSDDRGRWRNHLSPHFGKLRPGEVDVATIRSFAEAKLSEGMNHDTLRLCIACLSTLMSDLAERPVETGLTVNPCLRLPRSLRRLWKSTHDPRFVPYIERLSDVPRLFQAMEEPQRVAYALGVIAGMRPGEILALRWDRIHDGEQLDVREQVQNGRLGPLKDNEARILCGDYLAPLWPVLKLWRLRTGGEGLLFPPELTKTSHNQCGKFMHPRRLSEALELAVKACGLPAVMQWQKPWYQATRHTMATHWLRAGHSLGELAMALGHSATWVTERYAHIRPGPTQGDPWTLDFLEPVGAVVVPFVGRMGQE